MLSGAVHLPKKGPESRESQETRRALTQLLPQVWNGLYERSHHDVKALQRD